MFMYNYRNIYNYAFFLKFVLMPTCIQQEVTSCLIETLRMTLHYAVNLPCKGVVVNKLFVICTLLS